MENHRQADNLDKSRSEMFNFLLAPIVFKEHSTTTSTENSENCDNSSDRKSPQLNKSIDLYYDLITNPFMINALDVTKFQVLFDGESVDVLNEIREPFKPLMAHQIFGNDEVIMGYRNLKLNFSFLPNSFHTNFNYTYSDRYNNPMKGEIPDKIEESLKDWFPHIVSSEQFDLLKEKEDLMQVYGDVIATIPMIDKTGNSTNIYITKCDQRNEGFLAFHKRFQALIVFFIDAASIIEFLDTNWLYYYIYKDIIIDGKLISKLPIGFCTVYKFVLSKRARISQFFILPNFQQRGIGSRLLGIIYRELLPDNDIKSITVEYPCEEFSMLRDKLDLRFIVSLPKFSKEEVLKGYDPSKSLAAAKLLKLCPEQARHLTCVLRHYYSVGSVSYQCELIRYLKKNCFAKYKKKLKRLVCKAGKEERVARLSKIVHDDYMENVTIEKEVTAYIRRISKLSSAIQTLLN